MAEKKEQSGRQVRALRVLLFMGRGLLWLIALPFHIALLLWTLLTRSILVLASLLLCGYFIISTTVTGPMVFGLLNEQLLGNFGAEHVYIDLVKMRVTAFDVRITHPSGQDVITAGRAEASIDALALAIWGAKQAVGVSAQVPVHLRDLTAVDYRVVIPFTEEDGIIFQETFEPAVITPDEGPPGPPPLITLSHIWLGAGKVELLWPDWRMDIEVDSIASDIRILGGDAMLLTARGIRGGAFTISDLLPEPVTFTAQKSSSFDVMNFRLTLEGLEVRDGYFKHPDMDVHVESFAFNWEKEEMPCEGVGTVQLLSPDKLEHLAYGHVFGTASVSFRMFGDIRLPDFEFNIQSPRIIAEGMEFLNVTINAGLDLQDGVDVAIPWAAVEYAGGDISMTDGTISIDGAGIPDIRFEGSLDGVPPMLVLSDLGMGEFVDYADLVASGHCHGCRIGQGRDGVRFDGTLSLTTDVGGLERITGFKGGELEGFVSWDSDTVTWKGVTAVTDIGRLSSVGLLTIGDEISGRAEASLQVDSLGSVPLLGLLGMDGSAVVDELSFSGTMARPRVTLAGHLYDLAFAGEHFESLDVDAILDQWDLVVSSFCFRHGENSGCLSARASLGEQFAATNLELPVSLSISEPISVDLGKLPFLSLPLDGRVAVGPAKLSGTVVNDFIETVSNFEGEATIEVEDFAYSDISARLISTTISKEPLLDGRSLVGPMEASLRAERVRMQDLGVDSVKADVSVLKLPGRTLDTGSIPFAVGKASVDLSGIRYRDSKLSGFALELSGIEQDGRSDRVAFKGRLQPTVGPPLRYSGELFPDDRKGRLKLTMYGVALASLPPDFVSQDIRELLADTLVSGSVSAGNIDLDALFAGNVARVFKGLNGEGRLHVDNLERLPEPVSSAHCRFRFSGGKVAVRPLLLRLVNGSRLRVDGSYWPLRSRIAADFSLGKTSLAGLKTFRETGVPLDGTVWGTLSLDGPITHPRVEAGLSTSGFSAADIMLGDASVRITGEVGKKLDITSPGFFPGFTLNSGTITFLGLEPDKLLLSFDFAGFDLNSIVELPDYLSARADGHASMEARFTSGREPFDMLVDIPVEKLVVEASTADIELHMTNPSPARISVTSEAARLHGVSISGDGHTLAGDGEIHFVRGWDMDIRLGIDLSTIQLLGEYFASYAGRIGAMKEPLHLSGPMETPRASGSLLVANLTLQPRGMGNEIAVPHAALMVSGTVLDGNLLGLVEEDVPLNGTFDEGEFSIYGWLRFTDWVPDSGLLFFAGKELYYQEPGQFRLLLSPRVEIVLKDLTKEEAAGGSISGDVFVSEGEYTRNFDTLLGSFATAFSRSQERYSKPLTESIPFLKNVEMDLRVRGGNFAISSRFPFGETELAVNLDMKVGGTFDEPLVWEWMHVVPGGTITYKLVKRVFTVTQGSVEFSEDPTQPYLDIEAQTEVPYSGSTIDMAASSVEEDMWGTTVDITIRLRGIYPNLEPEYFSNRPGFDDADLQSLLLLGMTRKDIEGRSEGGERADISFNLLTEDVAGMVSKLLLAPFVDSVSLGFTQEGGIMAEAATKIGRAINVSARVRQDSSGSEYSAKIRFKITDRLSLEGRMKTIEDEQETLRRYEGKFRYIIPLE